MKWQQRIRVATGLSCWQIVLHLAVIALLVMGWMSGALVKVGIGLCLLYGATVLMMFALQRVHEGRLRELGDFLESSPPPWYFGNAIIALWLLSRIVHTT